MKPEDYKKAKELCAKADEIIKRLPPISEIKKILSKERDMLQKNKNERRN